MRDRIALLGYLGAVLAGTAIHRPPVLAVALLLVLLLAGRQCLRILRRAVVAVLFFNLVVTLSYIVVSRLHGTFSLDYVVLVNLRVLFLTSLTFLFAARVNPFRALSFSPTLSYLSTLAFGQAMTFRRVLSDFRLAFKSRCIERAALKDRYRHSASAGAFLLEKSLYHATEMTRVMRSRGFFDD